VEVSWFAARYWPRGTLMYFIRGVADPDRTSESWKVQIAVPHPEPHPNGPLPTTISLFEVNSMLG
jgi:hypothetical protein